MFGYELKQTTFEIIRKQLENEKKKKNDIVHVVCTGIGKWVFYENVMWLDSMRLFADWFNKCCDEMTRIFFLMNADLNIRDDIHI